MLESRPDRQNARVEASLEISDKKQLETILSEYPPHQRRVRRGAHLSDVEPVAAAWPNARYSAGHSTIYCPRFPLEYSYAEIPSLLRCVPAASCGL